MDWRTAAMISFITCQSSMLRLPGSRCSTVTLTSFGISRAHVAKKTAGFVPSRLDHRLATFFGPDLGEVTKEASRESLASTNGATVQITRLT